MAIPDQTQALFPLLTEVQAAQLLNVHPRTLKKARGAGQLRYVHIGRCIRYTIADIERFIHARTVANDRFPDSPVSARTRRTAPKSKKIVPFSELVTR